MQPLSEGMVGWVLQGPGAIQSSYLAATSQKHVLLFDTRHFNAPVLCWAHKMDSEPPQLLAFALSSAFPGQTCICFAYVCKVLYVTTCECQIKHRILATLCHSAASWQLPHVIHFVPSFATLVR